MSEKEFRDHVQILRELTFLMTDEESMIVIDEYINDNPFLLEEKNKEWFYKYC